MVSLSNHEVLPPAVIAFPPFTARSHSETGVLHSNRSTGSIWPNEAVQNFDRLTMRATCQRH
jgi:hypothetical protein